MDIIDAGFITLGTAYSLANIETILGVIILSIQLIWILSKCVFKIVQFAKKKISFNDLGGSIDEALETVKSIREELQDTDGVNDQKE